ncbi:hypothetical protein VPH35_119356 [Triticum aestivum]|uniref:uncharacterized protein n=1 Tax=Triticum aestivum TaxID=4565 RepID=UPI0008424BA4|nr:uncharacterized protein LOC123146224 [Triticum aestivum]
MDPGGAAAAKLAVWCWMWGMHDNSDDAGDGNKQFHLVASADFSHDTRMPGEFGSHLMNITPESDLVKLVAHDEPISDSNQCEANGGSASDTDMQLEVTLSTLAIQFFCRFYENVHMRGLTWQDDEYMQWVSGYHHIERTKGLSARFMNELIGVGCYSYFPFGPFGPGSTVITIPESAWAEISVGLQSMLITMLDSFLRPEHSNAMGLNNSACTLPPESVCVLVDVAVSSSVLADVAVSDTSMFDAAMPEFATVSEGVMAAAVVSNTAVSDGIMATAAVSDTAVSARVLNSTAVPDVMTDIHEAAGGNTVKKRSRSEVAVVTEHGRGPHSDKEGCAPMELPSENPKRKKSSVVMTTGQQCLQISAVQQMGVEQCGIEVCSNNLMGPSQRPYILPKKTTLPSELEKKVKEKVKTIQSKLPIFVRELKTYSVVGTGQGGCALVFCKEFASACGLPHTKKTTIHLQLEDKTKGPWPVTLIRSEHNSNQRWLTTGWNKFVTDNGLKKGDACLFQPDKSNNTQGLSMTVYLIRKSSEKEL